MQYACYKCIASFKNFNKLKKVKFDAQAINNLIFYKIYSTKYPLLSKVAKALLCVTSTSVPSECLFSHIGLIATKLRSMLSHFYHNYSASN